MNHKWDQARIQGYIDEQEQESLTLEYKRAAALGRESEKKEKITKAVSAMANSAGGIVIYGVKEYDQPDKRHLPEDIDPVDQTRVSREWLQQVINNVQPRIDGLVIYPVPINTAPNHVVYVVEVPQSTTAHQAADKRYYKRFNFQSVPMEDYEIRDVMARQKHPKIELGFKIEALGSRPMPTMYLLKVTAVNRGQVYAQYVVARLRISSDILRSSSSRIRKVISIYGRDYDEFSLTNSVGSGYGSAGFGPILPGLWHSWDFELCSDFASRALDSFVKWSVHADNAPPAQGEIRVINVERVERRLG
jgi:hypothetical protein